MRFARPSPIPGIDASVSASAVLMSTSAAGGGSPRRDRRWRAVPGARCGPPVRCPRPWPRAPAVPFAEPGAPRTGTTISSPSRTCAARFTATRSASGSRSAGERERVAGPRRPAAPGRRPGARRRLRRRPSPAVPGCAGRCGRRAARAARTTSRSARRPGPERDETARRRRRRPRSRSESEASRPSITRFGPSGKGCDRCG